MNAVEIKGLNKSFGKRTIIELLSFIFNIFSMKKESGKNKTNSNTDIE